LEVDTTNGAREDVEKMEEESGDLEKAKLDEGEDEEASPSVVELSVVGLIEARGAWKIV
jgi:hypothetical protein